MEKATSSAPHDGKVQQDTAESKTLSMLSNGPVSLRDPVLSLKLGTKRENRDTYWSPLQKREQSPSQPSGQKTSQTVPLT